MRRHAAVRIDLVRRKRQNGAFGRRFRQAFERRQEERDVAHRLLEVAVRRHDEERSAVGSAMRGDATYSALAAGLSPDTAAA